MILSNFLYRVGQYARDNRARLIKWLLILAVAAIIGVLFFKAVESYQRWTYEKKVQALEQQFHDADQKAKDAEARADAKQKEIDAKQSELQFLETRAGEAENKLRNVKQKVVTLKETYETIRYTPMPIGPVSCEDACRDLARLGYECR